MLKCKYCEREAPNKNSNTQHEIRCKLNPDKTVSNSYNHFQNYIENNRKGKNKYNCESIAKQALKLKEGYASGRIIPYCKGKVGTYTGKKHTEDEKKRIGESVSKARTKGYADGSIKPARGVGRGKYSYIIYNENKFMLRSTYEFIYALYLIYNNITFEMESVKVPAIRDNMYAKTFLSDFKIDNTIVEVKGIPSGKDYYVKESFEAAGYEFKELFIKDIEECKKWLKNYGININKLLNYVIEGHNKKDYFIYKINMVR